MKSRPAAARATCAFSILGFASCLALEFYCLFFRSTFLEATTLPLAESAATQGLYFVAFCAAYVYMSQHADWVFKTRSVTALFGIAVLLVPFALTAIEPAVSDGSLFIGALGWIGLGFGICWLRTLWELYGNLFYSKQTELQICLAFLISALLLSALVLLRPFGLAFAACVVALTLFAAGFASLLLRPVNDRQMQLMTDSQQFSTYITQDTLGNAVQGMVLGCTVATVLSFGPHAHAILPISFIAGGLTAILVTLLRHQRNYDLGLLLGRLLPLAIFFLIVSPLLSEQGRIVCCCIVLAILIYAQARKIVLGIVLNNQLKLNPITHSTLVPLPYVAGAFIGYMVLFALYFYLDLSATEFFVVTSVAAFVVYAALYVTRTRHNAQLSTAAHLEAETAKPGSSEAVPEQTDSLKHYLDERCRRIIEDRGLTPKESEVLKLLVRGRNAEFISNTLFISLATARTHIYHIYAKLEVSSHQQLLDVFEAIGSEDE